MVQETTEGFDQMMLPSRQPSTICLMLEQHTVLMKLFRCTLTSRWSRRQRHKGM